MWSVRWLTRWNNTVILSLRLLTAHHGRQHGLTHPAPVWLETGWLALLSPEQFQAQNSLWVEAVSSAPLSHHGNDRFYQGQDCSTEFIFYPRWGKCLQFITMLLLRHDNTSLTDCVRVYCTWVSQLSVCQQHMEVFDSVHLLRCVAHVNKLFMAFSDCKNTIKMGCLRQSVNSYRLPRGVVYYNCSFLFTSIVPVTPWVKGAKPF